MRDIVKTTLRGRCLCLRSWISYAWAVHSLRCDGPPYLGLLRAPENSAVALWVPYCQCGGGVTGCSVYSVIVWGSAFIPCRNLDEVFTYNHMTLMSLRSSSRVNESIVLTRADHLFIHNYI